MPNLGPTEIIIIAVVVLILFGAKKLPDASRSLGRSMRIFKAETKGLRHEEGDDSSDSRDSRDSEKGTKSQNEQNPAGQSQPPHSATAEPLQLPSSSRLSTEDSGNVNGDRAHERR